MRKEEYSLIKKRILAFHFSYNENIYRYSILGFSVGAKNIED